MCAELEVGTLVQVAEALESVLSPCFGPQGGQVLFTSATGEMLITRDGATILDSLMLEHPVARLLVRAALSHCEQTGDGCKSLVLLVTGLLRAALPGGRCGRLGLCRGLARLEREVLPRLLAERLGPHCVRAPGPGLGLLEVATRVLTGGLAGKISPVQVAFLSHLACRYLRLVSGGGAGGLRRAVRLCSGGLAGLALAVGGLPVGNSRVVEGLPLSRGLAVEGLPVGDSRVVEGLPLSRGVAVDDGGGCSSRGPSTRALLLSGLLLPSLTQCGSTLAPSPATLPGARARHSAHLQRSLAGLQQLGVTLLLSGPLQPGPVLEEAAARGFSLVHGLGDGEMALLARLSGAQPVSCPRLASPRHVVSVRFLRPLPTGPGLLLGLRLPARLRPHCLLVCAPMPTLARQHLHAIASAYRLLNMLLPCQGPGEGQGPWEGDEQGPDPGAPGKGSERTTAGVPEWKGRGPDRDTEGQGGGREGASAGIPGQAGSERFDPGDAGTGTAGPGIPGQEGEQGREGGQAGLSGIADTEGTNGLITQTLASSGCPGPVRLGAGEAAAGPWQWGEWEPPAGSLLPAGGTFELLLHHYLELESRQHRCPDTRLACRLLAEAVLTIPRHLHGGSSPGTGSSRSFLLRARLQAGRAVPGGRCPLDVVAAKWLLLLSALQCGRRLLAVDRALPVRRLQPEHRAAAHTYTPD
ncbi:Bardet-Biedl syndrome 10 protein [Amblyraja radiata]|uniref:Bardet-Biedl syndrome 10 protein n=1 Tax=Amblyraja radiata TaxID=386614 RepID=UPI001402396A|nr:Bardet-Biedl syndrome 10 protein [Amblyraja radiata]